MTNKLTSVPSEIKYIDKILKLLRNAPDQTMSTLEIENLMNTQPNKEHFGKIFEKGSFNVKSDVDLSLVLNNIFLNKVLNFLLDEKLIYISESSEKYATLTTKGHLKILDWGFTYAHLAKKQNEYAKVGLWIIAAIGFVLSIINAFVLWSE